MVLDDYFERGIGSVNDEFKPIGIVALTIMMSLLKMDVIIELNLLNIEMWL